MERLGLPLTHTVRTVSKSSQYEAGITVQTDAREIDYEACFTGARFCLTMGLRDAGCAVDWLGDYEGKDLQNGIWGCGQCN